MKQKLLNSIRLRVMMLVALLCATFTGTAWGDEVTLTQSALGLSGSYSSGAEKTISGITFAHTDLMKNNDNIQAKATSGVIYNKTAFPGNITSVAITHSGTARATTILGSSDGTNWTEVTTGSGSITADFSNKSYTYFKITRGSNAAYWTQIVITYSAGGDPSLTESDLALTGAPVALSFDLYNNSAAQVINYTTSSTGAVTVAASDYINAVVNESAKTITVTPVKKTPSAQTITVNQAADATYAAGSATFTVTIDDSTPKTGGWYATSLSDIQAEDVFVIVGNNGSNYAMTNNNGTSSAPSAVAVTIEGDELTSDVDDNMKWNIGGNADDGYTFYVNGSTESWLYCTNTNNGVRVGDNNSNTFSIDEGYLKHGGTSRYVGVYNSSDWRCYTSNGGNIANQSFAFYVYQNNAAVKKPVITVDETFVGSTTATITCATDDATIYYSFDNENWTEYTDDLNITATTTIYAKATKDTDESEVASATTTKVLPTPTVAVSGEGELTVDLNGETNVSAGTLTAAVTYEQAAVEGAVVAWSSSNEAIATIDANTGAVTLLATGEVTFTATYAGNEDYAAATGTKTITVTDTKAPGASGNPYTVAQAIAATPATGTSANVYIRGIVSQFYNTSIVGDGANYRYYISDDGTTATQLLVYRGKKNSTDDFSSADDLLVGDVLTIYGGLTLYKDEAEVAAGNYIVSRVTKTDSDLTLTSSDEVELERTSANANPTSDITWETSSTGAITCESSNVAVATVTNAGVITAVGEGSATITISQAADATYKAGQTTVTVTVTDNRSAVATGIDLPVAQKTLTVDDMDDFAATCTEDAGFTGSITYTYATSDASIVDVDETTFSAEAPGSANITITATPTGGNAANYKQASQVVAVTVNGTNSISLDLTSKTQAYSAGAFAITATVPTENYNGTVTAESSNPAVATVSVDGTTVTVTPVAVGTANITVTAGTGTYYPATAAETCEVTVTAPAGETKAPSSEVTYTFDFTDNTVWGFPTDYTTGENTYTKDGKTVTLNTPDDSNGYKFNTNVLLFGKTGATLTLPAFDKPVTQISTEGKTGSSSKVKFNIYVDDEAVSTEVTSSVDDQEFDINSEYQDAGTIYTLKVTNANNVQIPTLTVHMYQAPSATVQLNTSGYGTFCSVNPMDFTAPEGYTAWRISSIDMDGTTGTINCEKITDVIKGGQGVLLYNKNAGGVQTNATINFADGDTEFDDVENLLRGTTAPTFVEAGEVYGLSGNAFVPSNADGVIPAGKAYLNAASIPAGVKAFVFVFNDEATGITETRKATREEVESIFNIGGQRMSKMQRGVNIVNGKKVLVK